MNVYKIVSSISKYLPFKYRKAFRPTYEKINNLIRYGDPYFINGICLEVSTGCNRTCSYCPVSIYHPKFRVVSDEMILLYCKRINEINYNQESGITFYNEPLLIKDLPRIIKLMKTNSPQALITIFTNGDKLTLELAQKLIDSGAHRFHVSRHAPYSNEWDERINTLASSGIPIRIVAPGDGNFINRGGLVEIPAPNSMKGATSCNSPQNLTVTIDGDVLLCCNDYHREYVMGNITQNTLKEIYYNDKYVKIRKEIREGKFNNKMCKACVELD